MYTTLVTICQTANLGKVLRWYLILEQIFYINYGFIPFNNGQKPFSRTT